MRKVLHKFISEPLFDAAEALLTQLQIKVNAQSKEPLPFQELYQDATSSPMPKALEKVSRKITATYFIGAADDNTLAGRSSDFDLCQPLEGRYMTMLVFAVDVKPSHSLTRGEIATLTRGFNRLAPQLPVILIIRNGHKLSVATCERSEYRQNWREGEKLGRVSILRDIDSAHPHRGHLDILQTLAEKSLATFDDLYSHWFKVFSTELLTKRFYTELSEWYAWVISSGEVKFPNDISTTEDDMKYNHEAVIRLITRLIFVWFLKQKKLIPEEFFKEEAIREHFIENFDPHSDDTLFYNPRESKYYRLILQNLFFAMLNRPIKDEETGKGENRRFVKDRRFRGIRDDFNINNLLRYKSEFKDGGADRLLELANSQVPFLNGGLFECLDHKDKSDPEYGMYYDGFTENSVALRQLSFPDYFFFGEEMGSDVNLTDWYGDKKKAHSKVRGLINILSRYNFTVEENTPLDQEVSLDPELLGKVFENLLASYNPETNTTARKQTGSFYTPRPIVQYMIDESLIAYLKRTCPEISEESIRSLFDYSDENFEMSESDRKQIISALYECKVLDPACGSGAYPMGVLQQMVQALRKLDPSNEMWRDFILELSLGRDREAYKIQDEEERAARRRDIEEAFNKQINDPDYARKLYLIENCIYGVDIQPIAAQISKLRFFISLVAEQKPTSDPQSNFGIRPLPNLEAKIVSANSLVPLGEGDVFTTTEELMTLKKKLAEENHKLFIAKRNSDKRRLKGNIREIRKKYGAELLEIGVVDEPNAQKLAQWDMFNPNSYAGFFDPQWMFGMDTGFDIVIGNPPYIQLQNATGEKILDNKGKIYEVKYGDLYAPYNYATFARKGDMYGLFYELGYNLVKPGGTVCYITSNKWMRADYGHPLREFFSRHTNPQILIYFGGVKVFESATVDTNILLFSKEANTHATRSVVVGKENKIGSLNLSDFVQHNATEVDFSAMGGDSWVILSPIEQSIKRKIEAVGVPLKDWDISIYRGVLTGCNEAFIIDEDTREGILRNCADEDERKRTEELIRPILRGRDIKRYGYDWQGVYLIWIPWHFPFHLDISIKGASTKAEKAFKEGYPAVYNHLLQYKPQLSARNKAETGIRYEWYALQRWGANYWDDFSKPKVIYPNMTKFLPFYYDTKGFYQNDKSFMITGEKAAFLTAFLNSSLFKMCFIDNFPELQGGTRELRKIFFDKIPVIPVDKTINDEFEILVQHLQKKWDKEIAICIDQKIFDLYGLTKEEQSLIGFVEIV